MDCLSKETYSDRGGFFGDWKCEYSGIRHVSQSSKGGAGGYLSGVLRIGCGARKMVSRSIANIQIGV